MRFIVTGAGGFLGSALVAALARSGALPDGRAVTRLVAADARLGDTPGGVERREGDLADPVFQAEVLADAADVVVHLAALPSGAVIADPARGRVVNVEACFALFDRLARQRRPPRLVFASSIAVFGVPLPARAVDDDTLPLPTLSYGAHKLMSEVLLADLARQGRLDGIALRLPGILARPRTPAGHVSAFLSELLHALAVGEPVEMPVSPAARSWLMSRACCVDNLLHAAALPSDRIGPRRALTLPALHLSMQALVEVLAGRFGDAVRHGVTWSPQPEIEAQFGAYPPLHTPLADALGFRHDGTAETLVARALGLDGS